MAWQMDDSRPIYLQIMEIIQMEIVSGKYLPGDKIPSVRDLAVQAAVNPNTMQKALTELENMELLHSQRTSGRYITDDTKKIQDLKYQLAEFCSNEFLTKMKQLGFDTSELIVFIQQKTKEDL